MELQNLLTAVQTGNLVDVERLTSHQKINSQNYYNVLKEAISSGRIQEAKLLINRGCTLTPRDTLFNNELLHLSVTTGNLELVELLIKEGLNIKTLDEDQIPPFFKVVHLFSGELECSKILGCLLENEAAINSKYQSRAFTILHYAAEVGNVNIIRILAEKKCRLNAKSKDGSSALHVATKNGHFEFVDALVKQGAKSVVLDDNKKTPLCTAIEMNDIKILKLLLSFRRHCITKNKPFMIKSADSHLMVQLAISVENLAMLELLISNGAPVNSQSSHTKQSALSLAIEKGNLQIINLILQHDPNFHEGDKEGLTALHLACVKGNIPIISALLKTNKFNVNSTSKKGSTALHLAVKEGHSKVVKLLLEKGADYKLCDKTNKSPLTFALECTRGDVITLKILLNYIRRVENLENNNFSLPPEDNLLLNYYTNARKKKNGCSALHLAVDKEDKAVVYLLLKHHACIDVVDKKGYTPFEWATINGSHSIINMFLKSTANPQYFFVPREKNGITAMHIAVEKENTDILKLFFKYGISADISEKFGVAPLHIAARNNKKDLIRLLLKNGANVDDPGRNVSESPLLIAAENGNIEIVEMLSEASTKRSTEWTEGYLVMYIAAYYGHENIVKMLLNKRVNPNANVDEYLTPLHAAAQKGHKKIVDLLLEHGAKINPYRSTDEIEHAFISTPLLAASYSGHTEIVHLFLKHGADVNTQLKIANKKPATDTEQILLQGSYKNSEIRKEASLVGYTPLHFAVETGAEDTVRLLLKYGAAVNFRSIKDVSPIGLAIEQENEMMVRDLLFAGANVSINHKNTSILKMEGLKRNVKIAELIVKYVSSSQSYCMYDGKITLLGLAVENELESYVEKLLEAQTDASVEHKKQPVLHIAVKQENLAIIKMLLKHGVDVNVNTRENGTALLIAVESKKANIVQTLLDAGADPKIFKPYIRNFAFIPEDYKPFDLAIVMGNDAIVEIFLKNERYDFYSAESPFHLALRKSNSQVVEMFLKYGASIEMKDVKGKLPIFYAVDGSNLQIVKFLLKKGASLKTDSGESLLHFALFSECDDEEIFQVLMDYGIDVNVKNEEGRSVLNQLLTRKYIDKGYGREAMRQKWLKLLLLNGADPNQMDIGEGSTMLGLAIKIQDPELVKLLLLYGADVCFLDRKKETPLKTAISRATMKSEKYESRYGSPTLMLNTSKELDNLEYDMNYVKLNTKISKNARILPFRESVRLLIQELARRKAVNEEIDQQSNYLIYWQYVKKYYERCKKEIELMKVTNICQGILYFDVLAGNYNKLASLARNNDVKKILLPENQVSKLFPEYSGLLTGRIEIGRDRRYLIDSSHHLLKNILRYNWPFLIVEHVFSFLSNRDLRNLKSACRNDMFF